MNHPPAAGGKTAWGVSELLSSKAVEDPDEMRKIKEAQAEFQAREENRLQRLDFMQSRAGDIVAARRERNLGFDMKAGGHAEYENRLKQDGILRKMLEAKEEKRQKRKEERAALGITKKKKVKKSKKEDESSSSGSSSSGSSSSSSSKKKKGTKEKKWKDGAVMLFSEMKEAETVTVQKEEVELDPEQARLAAEARTREREVKRKAKEQAALWAEEVKRKEAEAEAKRQAEARKKAEELEAKKRADAEAKKKAEEEEAKKKAEEEEEKEKAGDPESKKRLFAADAGTRNVKSKVSTGEKSKPVIGGFFEGQTVYASKNITVKGQVVIKMNAQGTVAGPAENNPTQRIAVEFLKREDRLVGRMNVVPAEIKKRR